MTAEEIIATLGLQLHPEGGRFVETFRSSTEAGVRAAGTAIYFLLERGERSHWHRVDADEIWLWHAGAPLALHVAAPGQAVSTMLLGGDLAQGQRPQGVVARGCWQAAESHGDWSLVSCVVTPGFEFSGFELAPPGWAPV